MAEQQKTAAVTAEAEAINLDEFSGLLEKDFKVKKDDSEKLQQLVRNLALAAQSPQLGQSPAQSTLAPESFTIFAYFGISLRINAANCSGVVGAGSAPCCAKNAFISAVARMRVTSAFHLAMISFGVPAGAMKPHQV